MNKEDKKIIGATAVIENDGKHFLIQQSRNKPMAGKWRHLGGHFKEEETPEDAIKRELKEELNANVLSVENNPLMIAKHDYKLAYFSFYKVRLKNDNFIINKNEINNSGWFTIEEIKKLDLMGATRKFYEKLYF